MRATNRWILGALALAALVTAGCETVASAGRSTGRAAGDTAEKAGDAAGAAARGAGDVIEETAEGAKRDIED
jgi:hypothetical protein